MTNGVQRGGTPFVSPLEFPMDGLDLHRRFNGQSISKDEYQTIHARRKAQ